MALVFTPSRQNTQSDINALGGFLALAGTLTFSGSYATGGDTLDLGKLFRGIGAGKVFAVVSPVRGHSAEYDEVNKKLKLYSSANTEHAAAAYNAALTASPVPVVVLGR